VVWNKVRQLQRKQTDSHKLCLKYSPLAQTQAYASVLAIGQLRHQSATVLSLATHAADAVAANQRDSG